MKHNKNTNVKKPTPKRICRDPHTVYCLGLTKYGHRGCCECVEYNGGYWDSPCNPYLLPEETAALKVWWEENDMGKWEDGSLNRPNMKKRGNK